MKQFLVIFLTTLALMWLAAQARTAKARHEGDVWVFRLASGVMLVYYGMLAFSLTLFVGGILGPSEDRNLVCIGAIGFLVFDLVTWPKGIYVFPSGIRQRRWNTKWKSIEWQEITGVEQKKGGIVLVRAAGRKITFTQYHAGHDKFLEKLKNHHLRVQSG